MARPPKKPPGLKVIRGGKARLRPVVKEDTPTYTVELRKDLHGNLILYDRASGEPMDLARPVVFTLPIEALRAPDDD